MAPLLILDEVMCGRAAPARFTRGNRRTLPPDIQAIAKGLGGGYQPIGAMLASADIIDTVRQGSGAFQHGHTYLAHPLACAAAPRCSGSLTKRKLLERVRDPRQLPSSDG